MPPADDKSSLERARERLYKAGGPSRRRVAPARGPASEIPHAWAGKPTAQPLPVRTRHVRLASVFFVGTVIFFVAALGVAAYFFYAGGNTVSNEKVNIEITGPATIASGDRVPLTLAITNKNPTALVQASLDIDFPEGTRSNENIEAPFPRYAEDFDSIESGATITRQISPVIFGSAGDTVTIPLSLTYRTAGSNAVFVKRASYELTISSTPLSVSVDTFSEAVSGQPLTLRLTIRSNATVPLAHVVLASTLPFGFTVESSSIPLRNGSMYLGTLPPGASKQASITGRLIGPVGQERVFRFVLGTAEDEDDLVPRVTYMTQDATVTMRAPFISTTLKIGGADADGAVLTPGSVQNVQLSYQNTLASSITNATVRVTVSGSGLDYSSIESSGGFYDSNTHSIVYSQDTDPSLASLAPGATGIGTFSFRTLPGSSLGSSPTIRFSVSVTGTRMDESNVPEAVSGGATYSARVASGLGFSTASSFSSPLIANTGPVPPAVGQTTTYTILWSVKNSGNTVAGATVSATLPAYVTYTNKTAGVGAISYNAATRQVTWTIGDLSPRAQAEGQFQVSLTPSTSQRGTAPVLVGAASFSGFDRFAGVAVSATAGAVTTETPGDAGYTGAKGTVQ